MKKRGNSDGWGNAEMRKREKPKKPVLANGKLRLENTGRKGKTPVLQAMDHGGRKQSIQLVAGVKRGHRRGIHWSPPKATSKKSEKG